MPTTEHPSHLQAATQERFRSMAARIARGQGMSPTREADVQDEIEEHLTLAYLAARDRGLDHAAALCACEDAFGSVTTCRQAFARQRRRSEWVEAVSLPRVLAWLMLLDITAAMVWTIDLTRGSTHATPPYVFVAVLFTVLGALGYGACVVAFRYGYRRIQRLRAQGAPVHAYAGAGALLAVAPPLWLFLGAGVAPRVLGAPLEQVPLWRQACSGALEIARALAALLL